MAFDLSAVKKSFIRPEMVTDPAEAATLRVLAKAGAFVRRKQKSSIRYSKKPSQPGQPPAAHRSGSFTRTKLNKKTGQSAQQSQSPLRELIFFGFDPTTKSVIVGPVQFLRARQQGIPETLEKGGTAVKLVPVRGVKGRKAVPGQAAAFKRLVAEGRIQTTPTEYFRKSIKIAARPSAYPAMVAESPKFCDAFKDAVTR